MSIHVHPKLANYPFPPSSPLATINLFLKSVSLFLFFKQVPLYHFFLDSIYKGYHMIFLLLCLTDFTQYDTLCVHPCYCKWHYFILFYDWVIFHGIYVPYPLYPLLCQWTFRLLPCPGYCKCCCHKHWGAWFLLDHVFLWIYAQEWDCRVIWFLYF